MTAASSHPTNSSYGTRTLALAAGALIALAALLAGLGVVVHNATSRGADDNVYPGKISVIGAAKVREWDGRNFTLSVPASWGQIATGPEIFKNASQQHFKPDVQEDIWEGQPSQAKPSTTCDPKLPCLDLQIERPTKAHALPTAAAYAHQQASFARQNPNSHYIDLGPVTTGGEHRWVWRWLSQTGQRESRSSIFVTCSHGAPAELWQVTTSAPIGASPTAAFSQILDSIHSSLPTQPRDGDCGDVAG